MDGHIMRCGTTGSCQLAVISEIVKRKSDSCKWRYTKYPDLVFCDVRALTHDKMLRCCGDSSRYDNIIDNGR